jgi:multidrug efflux pump
VVTKAAAETSRGGGSDRTLSATFALALVIVFLVLAAQFESFEHPIVILVTVRLAITGALVGVLANGATMNVFTQIGGILRMWKRRRSGSVPSS